MALYSIPIDFYLNRDLLEPSAGLCRSALCCTPRASQHMRLAC